MTYWVTLPHPAAAVGWFFLAAYLAIYVVGFLMLARWLTHRNHMPTIFSVPIAWVAMEVVRTYLFSGFGLVALSHSQVEFLPLIQISSITGAYGVSFLVAMGAAIIEHFITAFRTDRKSTWRWSVVGGSLVAAALVFGMLQLKQETESAGNATVALIQGSLDTEFGDNSENRRRAWADYSRMTGDVTSKNEIDLVVWPESMFFGNDGLLTITRYDSEMAQAELWEGVTLERFANISEVTAMQLVSSYGCKCLMGTGTTHYHDGSADRYNTAAYYDEHGRLIDEYYKMHPVMFGEYVPLGSVFPWLYRLTPLPNGLTPGIQPKSFAAGDLRIAPCICFENTVPHLVRENLATLEMQGTAAQSLVTLTNDGWFWGSAVLDLHLACGIFRAVENGKPMLIAANTGISAHIDDRGRVLDKTPKRKSRVIVANVKGQNGSTMYTRFGDWFGKGCALISLLAFVVVWIAPTK